MERLIIAVLAIVVVSGIAGTGRYIYRVQNYRLQTVLEKLTPYKDEVCYDIGNVEICDDEMFYPVLVRETWADTGAESEQVVATQNMAKWENATFGKVW